ncbi:efflux RND transporter permease subunit [Teredinibacter purpureus]|uniref:efflux RND transporter permease subunit n=1 Tax=Teredinibacter purpureus TaxID=2731756 RepID=UPI0005F7A56D|nr:efflux RND transporter permease subunit [Teredinibacter purpureus]
MSKIIDWFLDNPKAATLLLVMLLVGGFIGSKQLHKEVFPASLAPFIEITMVYPGAAPSEVEKQVVTRIEQVVADVPGIVELNSESRLGFGKVIIQYLDGYDSGKLINDLKSRVDAIITFPTDVERANIVQVENRPDLMFLALSGDVGEAKLKRTAETIRDRLSLIPGVALVALKGTREEEISIEVSEYNLRRYGLSFDDVASAIRSNSLNIPAGMVRTNSGNIQIQTRNQAYYREDFENIVVASQTNGSVVYLRDVANLKDGFVENDDRLIFNGRPGAIFQIVANDSDDVTQTTKALEKALEQENALLPTTMSIDVTFKMATVFEDRMSLLVENSISGLALVFMVLMLFLRAQLSIWVCVGIIASFSGAIFLMPLFDVALNMLSLFAFLLVLGIVVDDAIIVSESIYSQNQKGIYGKEAAARGVKSVYMPVMIAVISTIIFFLPLYFVADFAKPTTYPIVMVIVLCLIFSLIESLFILPVHLSKMGPEKKPTNRLMALFGRLSHVTSSKLTYFSESFYQPWVLKTVRAKGTTITTFVIIFIISIGFIAGGWIRSSFMPVVPNDYVDANVTLPEGSPATAVNRVAQRMSESAEAMKTDDVLLEANNGQPFITIIESQISGSNVRLFLGLERAGIRDISPELVASRWRELAGEIPEAVEYRLDYSINGVAPDIALDMSIASNDFADQRAAANAVALALSQYPGVYNIRDGLQGERSELEILLKPHAESLGITLGDVSNQIRQGYYGEEVQRIPRGNEDVKVMLRYPISERLGLDRFDNIRIRTQAGAEIPLAEVAELKIVPGYTVIKRKDRKRNIAITANVKEGHSGADIVYQLKQEYTTQWMKEHQGFSIDTGRNMQQEQKFVNRLAINFLLAMIAIYCLMTIAFKSYSQPLLVLTAIPFGFMGAVFGHLITGVELSMMSMLGFVACAGVVVNDNLVLLDRINRLVEEKTDIVQAVVEAATSRFRPIVLTSLTTFAGLIPIMFERSIQAKFLQPMVVSLSFGVLVATTVTLFLVPSLYLVMAGASRRLSARKHTNAAAAVDAPASV